MTDKIIVGLSGGVDSSVAALLLQRAGNELAGLFMQNWEEDGNGPCPADADRKDAVAVAARLGVPIHLCNFAAEYRMQVFSHFLAELRRGRTPNPDVLCNREIKFKTFLQHAQRLGAARIATGHYARVAKTADGARLLRARDASKDQTYFLHAIDQRALAMTEFPLGDLEKTAVRALAREASLPTHAKKDSTGICFIGERDFRPFLARHLPAQPGLLRTLDGETVGEHAGLAFYTLGQRGGLGIGGRRDAGEGAWYVVGKDAATNTLHVAQGDAAAAALAAHRLVASAPTWIAGQAPADAFRCTAMTRYRQTPQSCMVQLVDGECRVQFDAAQRAVTPGQSVVFYDGDVCLGGAVIERSDARFGGWTAVDHEEFSHA